MFLYLDSLGEEFPKSFIYKISKKSSGFFYKKAYIVIFITHILKNENLNNNELEFFRLVLSKIIKKYYSLNFNCDFHFRRKENLIIFDNRYILSIHFDKENMVYECIDSKSFSDRFRYFRFDLKDHDKYLFDKFMNFIDNFENE